MQLITCNGNLLCANYEKLTKNCAYARICAAPNIYIFCIYVTGSVKREIFVHTMIFQYTVNGEVIASV